MEFVISHLSKSYGKHQVLKDVDHAYEEGKIYGLLGRNGAGKTTLFHRKGEREDDHGQGDRGGMI